MSKDCAFGATGPTEEAVQIYKAMNALFGTQIRTVTGYPGGNQINLAIERGEIDGRCALSWSSVKATLPHWIDEKKLNVARPGVVRQACRPAGRAAADGSRAQRGGARQILSFLAARQVMGRPFFAPPDVPADRAAALRKAFIDTLDDQEFLAEADQAKLEITPVPARADRGSAKEISTRTNRALSVVKRKASGSCSTEPALMSTSRSPSPRSKRACAPPAAGRSSGGSPCSRALSSG